MYLTVFYVKKGTAKDNDSTSVNTCGTAENGKRAQSAETGSSGHQKLKQRWIAHIFIVHNNMPAKSNSFGPKQSHSKAATRHSTTWQHCKCNRSHKNPAAVVKGAHTSSHHKNVVNCLGCVAEGSQTEGRGWVQSASSRLSSCIQIRPRRPLGTHSSFQGRFDVRKSIRWKNECKNRKYSTVVWRVSLKSFQTPVNSRWSESHTPHGWEGYWNR